MLFILKNFEEGMRFHKEIPAEHSMVNVLKLLNLYPGEVCGKSGSEPLGLWAAPSIRQMQTAFWFLFQNQGR